MHSKQKRQQYETGRISDARDATAREMCRTPQEPMTERDRLIEDIDRMIDEVGRCLKAGMLEGGLRRVREILVRAREHLEQT